MQADIGLRKREETFRLLIKWVGNAMVWIKNNRAIQLNHAAIRLFGLEKHKILGKMFQELSGIEPYSGNKRNQRIYVKFDKALMGEQVVFEWHISGRDNVELECMINLSEVRIDDEYILQVIIRITEEASKS